MAAVHPHHGPTANKLPGPTAEPEDDISSSTATQVQGASKGTTVHNHCLVGHAGRTLLGLAAAEGNEDAWFRLLDTGQHQPGQVDAFQDSPMHLAAAAGQLDMLELMQEYPMDVNAANCQGWTPLFHAVASGHLPSAAYLVKMGAALDHVDKCGNTALHIAAWYGCIESAEWLLKQQGMRAAAQLNHFGCRALDMAPPGPIRQLLHQHEVEQRLNEEHANE